MLPVVVPIAFLYERIAQTYELPERVDWLLYSTAQSIIIILAVSVLAITVPCAKIALLAVDSTLRSYGASCLLRSSYARRGLWLVDARLHGHSRCSGPVSP